LTLPKALALSTVAAVALVILPGREFGQRDHWMMIAVLPYLALCGRRFDGERAPGRSLTILIGVSAGLGLAFKPYFLAAPALIELAIQFLGKKRQNLFRAENIAIAAVIAGYAVWLAAFEQPYLRNVIPLAREVYWCFYRPYGAIAWPIELQLCGAAAFMFVAIQRRDGFAVVCAAAWLGFAFSYLIQHLGYYYHVIPARTVSLLLVARFALDRELTRPLRGFALAWAILLIAD
jgi:hypothetical protein